MKEEKRVLKSYVWFEDECFFVSTIKRDYFCGEGMSTGYETIAWEYNWETAERGKIIYQGGGIKDHIRFCRCMISEGAPPNENNPQHKRFFND